MACILGLMEIAMKVNGKSLLSMVKVRTSLQMGIPMWVSINLISQMVKANTNGVTVRLTQEIS